MRFQLQYMKKISSVFTDRIIYFLIIALFIVKFIDYSSGNYFQDNDFVYRENEREAVENYLQAKGPVNNLMVLDSLKWVGRQISKDMGVWGSSISIAGISLHKSRDRKENEKVKKYYLGLDNFYLRTSMRINLNGNDLRLTEINRGTSWQLPAVRYDLDDYMALFEISKTKFLVISVVMYALGFVLLILFLANTISLPLVVLSNISKGKFFAEKNLVNIRFIAKTTLIWTTVFMVLRVVMIMIYYQEIKRYFYFDWLAFFKDYAILYILGLVALLLSRAFNRGYQLQQENDLIV